jgi:phage antirepressor YoqD-like protein
MNDLARVGLAMAQAMTVAQVAEALGYEPDTIRKKVKELFPDCVEIGKTTYLSEVQVYTLKQALVPRTLALKSGVGKAVVALEMADKAREVMSWLMSETDRLRAELSEAAPKVESFNALMRSEQTMSITDASKHFGLHPKTEVFPYLREHGYLTGLDLPTQSAIDAGYLTMREVERRGDSRIIKQACVLASQLETWRTRVVPQIKAWEELL